MAKENDLGAMPTGAWDVLQGAVDRFEAAWEKGPPPRIEDFLPADAGQRLAVLHELVLVDLELRFKAGKMVQVEVYLKRFPELAPQAVELIAAEFEHQRRRDPAVSVEEYLQRFPQYREQLRGRLSAVDPERTVAYQVPESAPSVTQICANAAPAAAPPVPAGKISCSADLVKVLIGGNFLRPVHQDKVSRDLQHRFPDASALAGQLVRLGWLTEYQANLILKGKAHELLFGSYILLEPVGKGGMGEVYKARHRLMKRVAALKMVRGDWLGDRDTVRRFMREVQVAAQLAHPNIVAAYEASEVNGALFLAMEYVEGTDLGRLLRQQGKLPAGEACEFVRQSALGLQHGHERGLVHRDIKPGNLMRTTIPAQGDVPDRPLIKILDLGLARLEHDTGDERGQARTRLGALMGTPDYIAPEQAADTHRADIRADIYSLGCTLYHLLSGQVPFPGGTLMDKLDGHGRREARPLEELCPGLPRALGAVVRKMMAKKAADRYQTPGEVAAALAPYCGVPVTAIVAVHAPAQGATAAIAPLASTSTSAVPPNAVPVLGADLPRAIPMAQANPVSQPLSPPLDPIPALASGPPALKSRSWLWAVGLGGAGLVALLVVVLLVMNLAGGGEEPKGGPGNPVVPPRSPLDELKAEDIPAALREELPKEAVAVLGDDRVTHKAGVTSIAVSPDGKWIATGGGGEVLLSDAMTLRPVRSLPALHTNYGTYWSLTFSPDGKKLAGVNPLQMWDVTTGEKTWEKSVEKEQFMSARFTPDGKRLLTSSHNHPLRLWDVDTGKMLKQFDGDDPTYYPRTALSPDGTKALSAGKDKSVWLWDATGKEVLDKWQVHAGAVMQTAFSPDGKLAITGDLAGVVAVWDVASGKRKHWLGVGVTTMVTGVHFLPGNRILASDYTGRVHVWDLENEKKTCEIHIRSGDALVCAALLEGGAKVIVPDQKTIRVFDTATGKEIVPKAPCSSRVSCVAFCPDGRHLLSGSQGLSGIARLWDLATGQEAYRLLSHGGINSLALTADGTRAAAVGIDLVGWEVTTGKELFRTGSWGSGVGSLRFTLGGEWLLAGSFEKGDIRFLDGKTGKGDKTFKSGKSPYITNIEVFADGKRAVSGHMVYTCKQDGDISIWDIPTGDMIKPWSFPEMAFVVLRPSPDQRYLYAGGENGELWIWDLTQMNAEPVKIKAHKSSVRSLVLSANGQTLFSYDSETLIKWAVPDGDKVKVWPLPGLTDGWRQAIDLAPDGRHLAIGRNDGRILILRLGTPRD